MTLVSRECVHTDTRPKADSYTIGENKATPAFILLLRIACNFKLLSGIFHLVSLDLHSAVLTHRSSHGDVTLRLPFQRSTVDCQLPAATWDSPRIFVLSCGSASA